MKRKTRKEKIKSRVRKQISEVRLKEEKVVKGEEFRAEGKQVKKDLVKTLVITLGVMVSLAFLWWRK